MRKQVQLLPDLQVQRGGAAAHGCVKAACARTEQEQVRWRRRGEATDCERRMRGPARAPFKHTLFLAMESITSFGMVFA
jgi:hypothetical protein